MRYGGPAGARPRQLKPALPDAAMNRASAAAARIQQIENEQDEILRQLEELERRTEAALAEHAPAADLLIEPADQGPKLETE